MTEATDAPADAPPEMEFRPVTPERWPDLARLFDGRGGPRHCWCMVWRPWPAGVERSRETKRAEMERTVLGRTPVGILAYVEGEPVAWCSVAPRETYRKLGGDDYAPGTNVWAIACFFAQRPQRGRGITARLLDAACAEAAAAGADVVEGYPVDPDSPSYKFMGYCSTFLAAGFEEIGHVGTRRHVMQRWLRS